MGRIWGCSLLASTMGCAMQASGSVPSLPWSLVVVPVLVGLLAALVTLRPSFLDTMVRVQQRRMRRLLLALKKAAGEGKVDLSSDWYNDRTGLIERYVGSRPADMPGATSLALALVRAAPRAGSTERMRSERDFDAQLLVLVVRVARYRSAGLWLLPGAAWTWWARWIAKRSDPGLLLESIERDRANRVARASKAHRKYPRRGPSVSVASDPGL